MGPAAAGAARGAGATVWYTRIMDFLRWTRNRRDLGARAFGPVLAVTVAVSLAACGDDVTTATDAATTSATPTEAGSTSAMTTAGTGADTSAGTGAMTTAGTETSAGATVGTTSTGTSVGSETETSSGSSDGTMTTGTTGDGVCEFVGTESIAAALFDADEPDNSCGKVTFMGRFDAGGDGDWKLDTCSCGSQCLVPDPWTFTLDGPADWMPEMPMCPRIVLETVPSFDPELCLLKGVAIWDLDEPMAPPVYIAGGMPPQLPEVFGVEVASVLDEVCPCDGCCGDDEQHHLEFEAGDELLSLAEGEVGAMTIEGEAYDVANFQSHVIGLCDAPAEVYWAIRAAP